LFHPQLKWEIPGLDWTFVKGGGWMARIEESVEIKCPVDKVFAYTTEAKSWPRWQSFITEAEQTSEGHMTVDTTFKV
jgi:hypothetical protein